MSTGKPKFMNRTQERRTIDLAQAYREQIEPSAMFYYELEEKLPRLIRYPQPQWEHIVLENDDQSTGSDDKDYHTSSDDSDGSESSGVPGHSDSTASSGGGTPGGSGKGRGPGGYGTNGNDSGQEGQGPDDFSDQDSPGQEPQDLDNAAEQAMERPQRSQQPQRSTEPSSAEDRAARDIYEQAKRNWEFPGTRCTAVVKIDGQYYLEVQENNSKVAYLFTLDDWRAFWDRSQYGKQMHRTYEELLAENPTMTVEEFYQDWYRLHPEEPWWRKYKYGDPPK